VAAVDVVGAAVVGAAVVGCAVVGGDGERAVTSGLGALQAATTTAAAASTAGCLHRIGGTVPAREHRRMAPATTIEAVGRYLAALNAHDADAVAAAVTGDFVNEHTSARGVSRAGRTAYRQALDGFLGRFVGLRYEVEDTLVDGNRAVVAYTMTAVVDGRPIAIRGVFRFVVRDGLVAHRVDYWDGAEFDRQIGQA
jgi:ketosteroid isomerase-like protein